MITRFFVIFDPLSPVHCYTWNWKFSTILHVPFKHGFWNSSVQVLTNLQSEDITSAQGSYLNLQSGDITSAQGSYLRKWTSLYRDHILSSLKIKLFLQILTWRSDFLRIHPMEPNNGKIFMFLKIYGNSRNNILSSQFFYYYITVWGATRLTCFQPGVWWTSVALRMPLLLAQYPLLYIGLCI